MFTFFNGAVMHERHKFACSNIPGYFGAIWDSQFAGQSSGGGARSGNATLDQLSGYYNVNYTSSGKFGGGAVTSFSSYNYGSGSYVDIEVDPSDTSWYLNSGSEWTCEFWVKTNHDYENSEYNYNTLKLFGIGGAADSDSLHIGEEDNTSWAKTYERTLLWVNGSTEYNDVISPYGRAYTTWSHHALVCDGNNNIKYYWNGALKRSITWNNSTTTRKVHFGMRGSNSQNRVYYYDEIRISDTQRYTTNFTTPSSEFVNDANTLALFHFDTSGDFATDDSS